MSERDPSLLLLIPAYNEEERIGPVLREFGEYFQKNYTGEFRLVVVLNGCRDNTLGVVEDIRKDFAFIEALVFEEPIGKGGALIEGLKIDSTSRLVGYVDADGATSPQAFHKLVGHTNEADCIIGSRWLPDSVLHRSQTWVRQFSSRCFHLIVELLFWMRIKDTQCPAKVMRREAVEQIHENLRIAGLAFDVNLIYSLKHAGYSVKEVATEWTDMLGSTVTRSLFRASLTMFLSVVRLRLVYSPFYNWLWPLRPLETWIYAKLGAPPPLPRKDSGVPLE